LSRETRRFVAALRADLQRRRWLRVHAAWIALITLLAAWGMSHALMALGLDRLSLRYALVFMAGYALMLGLLYLWARWLLSRDEGSDGLDGLDASGEVELRSASPGEDALPQIETGGGGDFGGAGAGGSFDVPQAITEPAGKVAEGALEALGGDEGVVVVVPLLLLLALVAALAGLLGATVFGLFGVEVLIGVAIDIALASVGGALAYKAQREGWLAFAWRRTRASAAGLLVVLVLAGAAVDHWMPKARSLPHAIRLWRGA
jgi:hypothetical protein